jgi:rhamnogalacturonan endolyase
MVQKGLVKSLQFKKRLFVKQRLVMFLVIFSAIGLCGPDGHAARFMESLDRGVVAVSKGGDQVYVGWRMFGTEPETVGYNVYRGETRLNASPITGSTNYMDNGGSLTSTYRVAAVIDGIEQELSDPVEVWSDFYHDVPLRRPAGGTSPDGVDYTYSPNDCSVGDLDGDGQYEIIVKWDPSNSKDNAHAGYSGNVYLDAYKVDGTFLWRIDLGINIRAGAHYTQFLVYDFDGDGRAEIVCKTADGTVDGPGSILGDPGADWRNAGGYILDGPEYLSVFDGLTGAFIDTVDYVPPRGNVCDWGDCHGNRVDRFLACAAYLDGQRPSIVMCRGYYTRTVLAAWDFANGKLIQRWVFDSSDPGNSAYAGQGNHNLSVADVDGDGRDEIIYGSCTIDDDGTGLYSTGLGHGDAMHVSDMDPSRPGLEVWQCHESGAAGATFRDAATGEILINHLNGADIGRACAANIDSRYPGYQLWSLAAAGTYTTSNVQISTSLPNLNHLLWWTGDLQRELLDVIGSAGANTILNKWGGDGAGRLLSLYNIPTDYSTASNNGTKGNPCLSGDILGDWREEIILRSSDNTKLRIFTTTELTNHRIYTLMHDPQYRLAIAWQNVGYNQPPHPSFYIGEGMITPPRPDIVLAIRDPNETEPPSPDPMAWAVRPYVSGHGRIAMQAALAIDVSGVEYYFACTYGGGHDSGWQNNTIYEDTGLTAGQTYTYIVKARDKSNHRNTTLTSIPASCIAENMTGLVYWDFEDGTAGTAFSNIPGGGSVDVVGGKTMYGYNPQYGPSFSFETLTGSGLSAYCNGGQDGYTTDASLNGWSPQAWTIEVSVKLFDIAGWRTIIGRDGSSQSEPQSDFYLQNNGVDNKFRINIDTVGEQRWILDGNYVPVKNKWYRLAVTSDGSTLKMYLDDGSGYAGIGSLDMSARSASDNALAATNYNWTFGRGWYNGMFTDHITGYLDNIRFSNGALSPDQFLGSSSPSVPWLYGDFTGDQFVNLNDWAVFSQLWLRRNCNSLGDFDWDSDCRIDLVELGQVINHWLTTQ